MGYRTRGRLILVCFDPGETTGFARLSLSKRLCLAEGTTSALTECAREGRARFGQFGLKGEGGVLGEEGSASRMALLTRVAWVEEVRDVLVDTFVVVIEDFILFRPEMDRSLLAPVRLTARYEQEMRGSGVRMAKQSAADAKRVVTDARLRRWGMYDPEEGGRPMGKHARDATRHGILFARRWSSHSNIRDLYSVGRLELISV